MEHKTTLIELRNVLRNYDYIKIDVFEMSAQLRVDEKTVISVKADESREHIDIEHILERRNVYFDTAEETIVYITQFRANEVATRSEQ